VIRHDGHMVKLKTKVLEPGDTMSLMKSITPDRCQQELQEVGGTDFGFAFGTAARFRVSVFKQKGNIGLVLRQIPNTFLTMEQLGLPTVCKELILRPRGLFLVTGPTGSGKSTSLASMINFINENVDHHIITIEDPIEFYHEHKKSTVNQREVGVDVPSFAEALRRTRDGVVEDYCNQDIAFPRLLLELYPGRRYLSRVGFNMLSFPTATPLDSWEQEQAIFCYEGRQPDLVAAKYDLLVMGHEDRDQLRLVLVGAAARFNGATVADIAADLEVLILRALDRPGAPVDQLLPQSRYRSSRPTAP